MIAVVAMLILLVGCILVIAWEHDKQVKRNIEADKILDKLKGIEVEDNFPKKSFYYKIKDLPSSHSIFISSIFD